MPAPCAPVGQHGILKPLLQSGVDVRADQLFGFWRDIDQLLSVMLHRGRHGDGFMLLARQFHIRRELGLCRDRRSLLRIALGF